MAKAPVRLNDTHDCPQHGSGKVISADSTVTFEGSSVARAGDKIKCENGSETTIQEGNACVVVNDQRVALVNDKTDHEGSLKSDASTIVIDEGEPFVFIGSRVEIGSHVIFCIQ